MKGKYLITTDAWFYAPNGRTYRAVWGEVNILSDGILGIKTNMRSTNWYARVGSEDNHVIVAGCQIHYAVKTDIIPDYDRIKDYSTNAGEFKEYLRPNEIYIAD